MLCSSTAPRSLPAGVGAASPHQVWSRKSGSQIPKTAADYLCERLIEWAVDTVYGFPAGRDPFDPGDCGVTQFGCGSSRPGDGRVHSMWAYEGHRAAWVCVATSRPGAIRLLNGLYDTKLDH